jgi:hypothetical protein
MGGVEKEGGVEWADDDVEKREAETGVHPGVSSASYSAKAECESEGKDAGRDDE